MNRPWKVIFNLGKGARYMKWKIEHEDGEAVYVEPNDVTLVMDNCKLVNHKKTAKKIFNGANKTVCAWIECENVKIKHEKLLIGGDMLTYNPRIQPNWVFNGENVDGETFDLIITNRRKLLTNT